MFAGYAMRHLVLHVALLLGVLLCASSWLAESLQLENLQGVKTRLHATKQLLPVCAARSAPTIASEMPDLMTASRADRWWEHTVDDDTRCNDLLYARPARALRTMSRSTALECAASCRFGDCSLRALVPSR
jgi:hypothetical protein